MYERLLERLKTPVLELIQDMGRSIESSNFQKFLKKVRVLCKAELKTQIKQSSIFKKVFLQATFGKIDELIGLVYDHVLDKNSIPAVDVGLVCITENIVFDQYFIANVLTKVKLSGKPLHILMADYIDECVRACIVEPLRSMEGDWSIDTILNKIKALSSQYEVVISKEQSRSKEPTSRKRARTEE